MAFWKLQCSVLLNLHFSVVSFCVCVWVFGGGVFVFVVVCILLTSFFWTVLSHSL